MQPTTKIPTLLGLVLVIGIVITVGFFFERITREATRASGSITPTHVEITNVSDSSFTLSWLTQSPATGALIVQTSSGPKQTLFDERDLTGKLGKYQTHAVTLHGGQGATEYEVKILSNSKTFLDGGSPYHVRTAPPLAQSGSSLEPAFGSILSTDGQPAGGALVYLTLNGGQKLSTLVKPSGSWLVPLNVARTSDLASYVTPGERMTETIIARFGEFEANATTDTLNDAPVPAIILGKSYDFRGQQASRANAPLATAAAPSVLGQTRDAPAFTITKPADGAALPTNLPIITGTGVPGIPVSVTIGMTHPIGGSTTIAADGLWSYTPPLPLTPGKQSVTATSQDATGRAVALTHTFEILKSGTQVLGDATPSATLTPTLTPTLTATPTPTSTLAAQPIPTSGNELPLIMLLLLGLGLFGGGAVLLAK